MAESTDFRTLEMNWHATDLPDEFAKFKQYCNLNIFWSVCEENRERTGIVHSSMDWKARDRDVQ